MGSDGFDSEIGLESAGLPHEEQNLALGLSSFVPQWGQNLGISSDFQKKKKENKDLGEKSCQQNVKIKRKLTKNIRKSLDLCRFDKVKHGST